MAQEAKAQGKGVEETARAMRYGFLTQAAQDLGADKLATAHHADDNAETVLLHLVRGAGLDGLTGIPPVRGILIRPLLAIPQSDIAAYLEQEGIPHVEDSSNFDLTYARNRLRQEVVPGAAGTQPCVYLHPHRQPGPPPGRTGICWKAWPSGPSRRPG